MLASYWLDLRCDCGNVVRYPLRLLGQRVGGDRRLGEVLPLLRCRRCGGRPSRIVLLDRPDDSEHGPKATVKIDLQGAGPVSEPRMPRGGVH
jgi:hypothetical protein